MNTIALYDAHEPDLAARGGVVLEDLAATAAFALDDWQLLADHRRTPFLLGCLEAARKDPLAPIVTLIDLRDERARSEDTGWDVVDALRSRPETARVCRNFLLTRHLSLQSVEFARSGVGADGVIEWVQRRVRAPIPAPGIAAILERAVAQLPNGAGNFLCFPPEVAVDERSLFAEEFEQRFGQEPHLDDLELLTLFAHGFNAHQIAPTMHRAEKTVSNRLDALRAASRNQWPPEAHAFCHYIAELLLDAHVTLREPTLTAGAPRPALFDAWQNPAVRDSAMLSRADETVLDAYLACNDPALVKRIAETMRDSQYLPASNRWLLAVQTHAPGLRTGTRPSERLTHALHIDLQKHVQRAVARRGAPALIHEPIEVLEKALRKLTASLEDHERAERSEEPLRAAQPRPMRAALRQSQIDEGINPPFQPRP